ncbi:MAG: trypsin-like serine protease [Phycisphaerales bacterium]|nr:trypsin-like serine protease [Phycisphaerales bacterium]
MATLVMSLGLAVPAMAVGSDVKPSVVKIFASKSPPNMFQPWQITPPSEVTGSGVIIEGGRILTNAHVVAYAQQIYVQPNESSEKLHAEIEFIAEDCDLATLRLEDPEAIADRQPVPLADALPKIKDKINVLGFPTGGDSLSITEGVVSRIEYGAYYYETAALRIQVDAAINPGNSGGPGIVDGKITGIVFSKLSEAENIGYLIPAEVIRHFLDDWTSNGRYDGFPKIDAAGATLENPALRDFLKLTREQTGVVIHRVNRPEIADLLKPWDVVTACDGVNVDNLGMVSIADGVRVDWPYLIARKSPGSTIKLDLIRDGQSLTVELPTITNRNTLVQRMTGKRPTYFIYGGLVFSPVTTELVQSAARYFAILGLRGSLLARKIRDYRTDTDDEMVALVSPILPHRLTKGYGVSPLSVVTHVNDEPVKNLRHMIQLVKDTSDKPFIIFRFENDYEEKIVLEPEQVARLTPEIMLNNNIPSACSEDMKDLCP